MDGGAEIVGAVELGHAAELPEAGFQAFGERLEALREADLDRLEIGVGQAPGGRAGAETARRPA